MSLISAAPTSTSTVRLGQSKLSWTAMPSSPCSTWPDPESSIGTQCQSLDHPIGRYKCWNLREKSPAFLVWKAVSKPILTLLDDQFEHLDTRGTELMVEMFMVGKRAEKTVPTILFSCKSKHARQKAMDLVAKKSLLADYPGVTMAQRSRLPRPLALGDYLDNIKLLLAGVYVQGPVLSGLSGLSVLIVGKDYGQPRRATIGGFLCINKEYYGLTVAHVFSEIKTAPEEDSDLEFSFYGDVNDSSDDEDEDLEMTSKGSVSTLSSRSGGFSVESDQLPTKRHNSLLSSREPSWSSKHTRDVSLDRDSQDIEELEPDPILIGSLFKTSSSGSSLDWALVKIDFNKLLLASLTFGTQEPGQMRMICDIVNNMISTGYLAREFAIAAADVNVLIRIGSGFRPATLSSSTSWKRSSEEKAFQELLRVKLDTGDFVDGDCGSWVLNPSNGRVYGHIISGYPEDGTAYLVPAWQTVVEIEKGVGPNGHVGFPLLEKVATIQSLFSDGPSRDSDTQKLKSDSTQLPGHTAFTASNMAGEINLNSPNEAAPQPSREKARPMYVYDVDEYGRPISGRQRSAEIEKQKTKTPHKSKSSSDRKQKSTLSEVKSDKEAKGPKIERRKSQATGGLGSVKMALRPPSTHRNAANSKNTKDDPSHYGIPTFMATGSPQQSIPIVSRPIPFRPRAVTSQDYPARPTSYYTSYTSGSGYGPPISASAYFQPPLMPGMTYTPPSPSSSHVHHPPPNPFGYFPPPQLDSRAPSSQIAIPEPVARTSSAYGFQSHPAHQQTSDEYDNDGYASEVSSENMRPSLRASIRRNPYGRVYNDLFGIPPPPRPGILRAATEYPNAQPGPFNINNPSSGYHGQYMTVNSSNQQLRPGFNRYPISYEADAARGGFGVVNPEMRNYYEQPSQANTRARREKSWEEKAREATTYQEDISSEPTIPLTAEVLRRQQRRGKSRSSSVSSTSRDERNKFWDEGSSYKNTASTRTTRSTRSDDDNDDGFTKRVVGAQARIMIGGAQINCEEGGEIRIQRQKATRNDSKRSSVGYGAPSPRIDDRKPRIGSLPGRVRMGSQSPPPTYSQATRYQRDNYF